MPGKREYFLVSTINDETNHNSVSVYRKQKQMFRIGGNFEDMILDLKMAVSSENKEPVLFMPKGMCALERIDVKGL